MKKIAVLITIILMPITANAQQRFNDGIYANRPLHQENGSTTVKFSYPMDFGIGFSYLNMKNGFTSQWNGYSAPTSFGMFEFLCCGFYFAMGEKTDYTKYDVLGWSIRTSGDYFRFGIELGKLYWYDNRSMQSLSVTPFYGTGRCGLSDDSGNTIGWDVREIDSFRQHIQHYGIKIAYTYNFLEIGFIASENEISVSLTGVIDCTKLWFL